MSRWRSVLPSAVLACATVLCIFLSIALRTGYDSHTKFRSLLLRIVLVTPALLWTLRQRREENSKTIVVGIRPFLLLFLLIIIPISWYTRDGIYNGDESAYRFEANSLHLLHHIYAEAPPEVVRPDFSYVHHVIYRGRWSGKYPPGWPAILALTDWLLPDWLINPLLGAILLWLLYEIAKRLTDAHVASTAAFFATLSAFFLFTCVGFMPHVACAVLIALATLFFINGTATHRGRDVALLFACVAAAFLVRPFTAAVVGFSLVFLLAWHLRKDKHQIYRAALIGSPFVLAAIAVLLYDNALVTRSFWISPYALYAQQNDFMTESFTGSNIIRYGIATATVSLGRTELHSFPFLLPIAAYAVFKKCIVGKAIILLVLPLSLVLGYMVTPFVSDSFVGGRYYFEGYFALIIMAAAGWVKLASEWSPSLLARRVAMTAAICLATYSCVDVARALIRKDMPTYTGLPNSCPVTT
jgi:Dolichyl-phosphate-mannose-protein mannosyltransferase